jgi:hypothetical protein
MLWHEMRQTTKNQIKTGLRLGGSLGLFFIAVMILGIALDGLHASSWHLRPWPDAAIVSGLIASASLILVFTARVWILYIAGCLLFVLPKCLIIVANGRSFYSPHEPFSRLVAIELGVFSLVSLFLIYRVTQNRTLAVVDRFAFTFFTLSLVLALGAQDLLLVAIWQVAGLAALCGAWLFSRRKHGRHRVGKFHAAS